MLHYWSEDNKRTIEALQIRYTTTYTGSMSGQKLDSKAYEYHKYATKNYMYVGMDEKTALACAKQKLAKYTKERFFWYYDSGKLNFYRKKEAVATVQCQHGDGHLWDVNISVNEDQVYYSFQWFDDPSGLFDNGDYDEDSPSGNVLCLQEYYKLNASPYPYVYMRFYKEIDNFSSDMFFVQYTANGKTWLDYDLPISVQHFDDGIVALGTTKQVPSNAYKWRLQYYVDDDNFILSNPIVVPDSSPSYSNTMYLGTPYENENAICFDYTQDFQNFNSGNLELYQSHDGTTFTESTGYMVIGTSIKTNLTSLEKSMYWMLKYGDYSSNIVYKYVPSTTTTITRIDGTTEEKEIVGDISWQGEEGAEEDNEIVDVVLGSTVTHIAGMAFTHNNELKTFQMNDGLLSIGSNVWEYDKKLTTMVIPNTVTEIGSYAFADCDNLTSITLSTSLTSIPKYFAYQSGLRSISIPDSVAEILELAFSGCSNLSEVSFGSGLLAIGDSAFSATALTNVTIPTGVTSIGKSAFYGCSNLGSVTIPSSVTTFGENCFQYCNSELAVYVKNETQRGLVLEANPTLSSTQVEIY